MFADNVIKKMFLVQLHMRAAGLFDTGIILLFLMSSNKGS